jgi:hypothetical protein
MKSHSEDGMTLQSTHPYAELGGLLKERFGLLLTVDECRELVETAGKLAADRAGLKRAPSMTRAETAQQCCCSDPECRANGCQVIASRWPVYSHNITGQPDTGGGK